MIQTITCKFPNPSDATRKERFPRSPTGWVNVPVPEAERRCNDLSLVSGTHPMLPIAMDCLKDKDTERPSAQQICHRLLALKEAPQYSQSVETRGGKRNGEIQEKEQLVQQLTQENEEREREVREKEVEIGHLRNQIKEVICEKEREGAEKNREIQSLRELIREKDQYQQVIEQLIQELTQENEEREREVREKEVEIGQLQNQVVEIRETEREGTEKNKEIQSLRGLIREKDEHLQEKDATICQLQQSISYTCQVSGPGLQSATANHLTHVLVELTDSSGRPCSHRQNITAELQAPSLQPSSQAKPTSTGRWPWSKKAASTAGQVPDISAAVDAISPSRYELSYTAVSRGQHKLRVRVNGREINGSPFTMIVYPDPTQLCHPVRVVTDMKQPYGIAFNSCGEMIVSEIGAHTVSVFNIRGQRIRTFGSEGGRSCQMKSPAGIAVDNDNNIYVGNIHALQKFTSRGELIKCIGSGMFNLIRGVTIHREKVYVCDRNNHRIQVFDLDLSFIRSIGSRGKERGNFYQPYDVKFDSAGNMYVADLNNDRVQVMDNSGQFVRVLNFGMEGQGKLDGPSALHIADKYVYVSDSRQHRIVVYDTSGHFINSFGWEGQREGQFQHPYCITSCADGFLYLCDSSNDRVQIF